MLTISGSNWSTSGVSVKAGRREGLLDDRAVKRFKDDRDEIVTLGTFDLLEGLDVVVLGAVHDRENLGNEAGFTAGPLASGTVIS